MNSEKFYTKLKEKQSSSQRWNAIINDILILYEYHFPMTEQLFSSEDLWDFLFTARENHLYFHSKIWNTFGNTKYNSFFSIVYTAMDDPEYAWWDLQSKAIL